MSYCGYNIDIYVCSLNIEQLISTTPIESTTQLLPKDNIYVPDQIRIWIIRVWSGSNPYTPIRVWSSTSQTKSVFRPYAYKMKKTIFRGGSRITSQGGALKKIAPSGGRRENIWDFSCEKSRFYAKKSYFFQFQGGAHHVRPLDPPPILKEIFNC